MPDKRDLKFHPPIKASVEVSAELYLKAAEYGAKLPAPMSVERVTEKALIELLDRAPHKITLQYKPERETR